MYTGWWPAYRYRLNRPLTDEEKKLALPRKAAPNEIFNDRNGLVALNSTYIEWIDRRFRARGMGTTFIVMALLIIILMMGFYILYFFDPVNELDAYLLAVNSLFCFFSAIGLYFLAPLPRLDFFQKLYYPIRFNRKNRMIYVYRDKRDGGILAVPWDKVFFHIGRGMQSPRLYDIRGEVLEDGIVKDTFALGPFMPETEGIRQMWAFIRRYMEGGPEAVGPDPLDRYVGMSLKPTLRNCLVMAQSNYGAPNLLIRIISLPFIAVSTLTRWLVFKTCSMPVWPDDIAQACQVAPDDPNVWPIPNTMNQFQIENRAIWERTLNRMRGDLRPVTPLANALEQWEREMGIERKRKS